MKRPVGITVLSLIFGWLSIGGFMSPVVLGDPELFPDSSGMLPAIGLAYGVSALLSCVGLWRMRRWALSVVRIWMAICFAFFFAFAANVPAGFILGGYAGLAAFLLVVGSLFFLADWYIRKRLPVV